MSNFEESSDSGQQSLFDAKETPGARDHDSIVRAVISEAIRKSTRSREQIADTMSRSVGREVTVAMLDAFTADSKKSHRFPLAWTSAFCAATNDWDLLAAIVKQSGFQLISRSEAALLDLGARYVESQRSMRNLRKVADKILATGGGQ